MTWAVHLVKLCCSVKKFWMWWEVWLGVGLIGRQCCKFFRTWSDLLLIMGALCRDLLPKLFWIGWLWCRQELWGFVVGHSDPLQYLTCSLKWEKCPHGWINKLHNLSCVTWPCIPMFILVILSSMWDENKCFPKHSMLNRVCQKSPDGLPFQDDFWSEDLCTLLWLILYTIHCFF